MRLQAMQYQSDHKTVMAWLKRADVVERLVTTIPEDSTKPPVRLHWRRKRRSHLLP